MKKLFFLSTLMLVMMMAMMPLKSFAQTSFYQVCSTGQRLLYRVDSTGVSVSGDDCLTGDMEIPSSVTHDGITYDVTSIGENAFYGCSGLTSLTIPSSVTSIGNYAFQGCSGLTLITIPGSVTSIGENAFRDCSGLTSITVDANNPIYDSRENCNAIVETSTNDLIVGCQNTIIPSSVTSIGDYAFYGCSGLTSLTIPSSVTSIGVFAFYGCSGLTSITIPSSVTFIGNSAFYGCSGLTSITIPSSVTSIGENAFRDCSGLTLITIPGSVTFIGDYAFCYCSGLTSITIPSSVSHIGNTVFSGCSGLTSITVEANNPTYDSRENCNAVVETSTNTLIAGCQNTIIPSSVTSIGENAFYGCSGLTSLTIPSSVTSIGVQAFEGCSGLTSITIPSSVTFILDYVFRYCSGLTSITIPSSVTSIGREAFSGCSGLTSITIPNSVTSIGWGAFQNCSGLTSITVDANNPRYDSRENCNAIVETSTNELIAGCQNTIIPSSVTSIGNPAFYGCSGLTSITIPSSVTSIGVFAFYGCSGLTSITIPSSVTSIGNAAFYGCSGLTSITIPSSVTSIESFAFSGCSGLTSITIPSSVTSISSAFYGCSGLTSITIPSSVTSIESFAFSGCSGLTSITIPSSVTSIGNRAFFGCSGLTSITVDANNPTYDSRENCNAIVETSTNQLIAGCQNTFIPSSVTSIGEDAFSRCSGLTSITIPSSVTSIGSYAFLNCNNLDSLLCLAAAPPVLGGNVFYGISENFQVFIPCGTLDNYRSAWPCDINFRGLEDKDTSITVFTSDPCYTWNDQTYCASGDYIQTFPTSSGCDSLVTLHLTITTGINDYTGHNRNMANAMTVYPNPTNGIVNVECEMGNGVSGDVTIQLYDIYGKLVGIVETQNSVETQNFASLQADAHGNNVQTAQIDLSRYANGVYFIKLVSGSGQYMATRKIVKR